MFWYDVQYLCRTNVEYLKKEGTQHIKTDQSWQPVFVL